MRERTLTTTPRTPKIFRRLLPIPRLFFALYKNFTRATEVIVGLNIMEAISRRFKTYTTDFNDYPGSLLLRVNAA
jgi:hypothetical protein